MTTPIKLSERLHKLASDIMFGAGPGEARFHQGALLRAITDAEVRALEDKVERLESAAGNLLNTAEGAIKIGDWVVDGRADPDLDIRRLKALLPSPPEDK